MRGTEQRDESQGHRKRGNLRCLIHALSCCGQMCEVGGSRSNGQTEKTTWTRRRPCAETDMYVDGNTDRQKTRLAV